MKNKLPEIIDLAVIGAGLSGLSCAVRGRFVKSSGSYSMATVVFEASDIEGGLASLGNIKITGPGFSMPGKKIVSGLLKDIDEYEIPVIRTRISKIARDEKKGLFLIEAGNGSVYLSRTVAVCSGMRGLSNEASYFGKGLKITYMGYDFINSMINAEIESIHEKRFMIYGNEYSKNLIDIVAGALEKNNIDKDKAIFLLNTNPEKFKNDKTFKKYPSLFEFGEVKEYKGRRKLEAIECSRGGKSFEIKLDSLLLDYNSFEIKPDFSIEIAAAENIFDRRGFIAVDRDMKTSIRGLYAAGDITGSYSCASRAISEGVIAGFSAYREVMSLKDVKDYSLFAYKAEDCLIKEEYREINSAHFKRGLVVLAGAKKIAAYFDARKGMKKIDIKKILNIFGMYYIITADRYEEIKRIFSAGDIQFYELLSDMANKKLITLA
ncbi:MAG TPA: FAD-dependent oxidoreductase [Candidatus Wallbacteria bacterium]|nr:FAD-dependent oxidoreductase [Candidatus Wallbacteria bacterium]